MLDATPSDRQAQHRALEIVRSRLLPDRPRSQIGRFHLRGTLGRGSQGHVYDAYDPVLERDVALKVVGCPDPKAIDRVLEEARALARVEHPCLVEIYDVLQDGAAVALAMEKVDGTTLGGWLKTRPSAREIVGLFERVADALATIHDARLVHRDLKPSNILVDIQGVPRIIDFGLAIGTESDGRRCSGTAAYMAPEQVLGLGVGKQTDQYTWALMFREALREVGKTSWEARCVIRRALAAEPQSRFGSLHTAIATLRRRRRLRRGAFIGGGVAALGLAAMVMAPTEAPPCTDLEIVDRSGWGEQQAQALHDDLSDLDAPVAEEMAAFVVSRVDSVVSDLRDEELSMCRAERADQTPRPHHRACLAAFSESLRAAVDLLHDFDEGSLADATTVISMLGHPGDCSHEIRSDRVPPIEQAVARRGQLRALSAACASRTANECVASFEGAFSDTDACWIRAEGLYQRALGRFTTGDHDLAREDFVGAAWEAEACGLETVEFDAKRLAGVVHAFGENAEAAEFWLAAAEASMRRTGENPRAAALLELTHGMAATDTDPDRAAEHLSNAASMFERFGSAGLGERVVALVNLGRALRVARMPGASETLADALALHRTLHGPRSMQAAHTMVSLAGAQLQEGHLDDSIASLTEAGSIYALYGEAGGRYAGQVQVNLCWSSPDGVRARRHCQRAIELARTLSGPSSVAALEARAALALRSVKDGDLATAAAGLGTLRSEAQHIEGIPASMREQWTMNLGVIEIKRERYAEASELICPLAGDAVADSDRPWPQRIHRVMGCAASLEASGEIDAALDVGEAFVRAIPEQYRATPDAVELHDAIDRARVSRAARRP